ncbi:tyrosine-type recombinase/integrase [Leptothoe sp. ISB3NOV94-8A]
MAKRRKTRHKKGAVVVWARNNMLRLRWRYDGKQRHLSLGLPDTPINRQIAERVSSEIARDIAYGEYDHTLDRYRLQHSSADQAVNQPSTYELFDEFIDYKREQGLSEQTIASRYRSVRSHIKRFGQDIKTPDDATTLVEKLRGQQSPTTANKNLGILKQFGRWLAIANHLDADPFVDIECLKVIKTKPRSHDVFTVQEVQALLLAFKTDERCSQFHDLCVVLFSLGLRPSEAIGLRWQHIDLKRRCVTICESLSRAGDGRTAGYARVRKETKTGSVRVLPLNERLIAMFRQRHGSESGADDLIFTTIKGQPINDQYIRDCCWKPMCKKAGIPYRPPYTARHTFISHGLEYKEWTLPQAAEMAGHANTKMVASTYAHMVQRPELPDY